MMLAWEIVLLPLLLCLQQRLALPRLWNRLMWRRDKSQNLQQEIVVARFDLLP